MKVNIRNIAKLVITESVRCWLNPALRTSIAGCQVGNPARSKIGWIRPNAEVVALYISSSCRLGLEQLSYVSSVLEVVQDQAIDLLIREVAFTRSSLLFADRHGRSGADTRKFRRKDIPQLSCIDR